MTSKSKLRRLLLMLLIMLLLLLAAVCAAAMLQEEDQTVLMDQEDYDELQRFSRMEEVTGLLQEHYVGDVDEEKMMEYAKYNVFNPLDDSYTMYYDASGMEAQTEKLEGQYAGIGLQLMGDMTGNTITVTRVFRDSPADRAGFQVGDVIVQVNGEPFNAATMTEAVSIMRGKPGTEVQVTIERLVSENEPIQTITYTLPREVVVMNSADYKIVGDNLGYVLLYDFMGTDVDGFFEALNYFAENQVRGLIIDLRDNRGGLVDDAVEIADALMPEGIIVSIENRGGVLQEVHSDAEALGWPTVVLVNEYSASASEILAGALQDSKVATIVGVTTFGKGVMQRVIEVGSDGDGMQFTIAQYTSPLGRNIHGIGIEPDVVVEQPEAARALGSNVDEADDVQLQKGIEVLEELIQARQEDADAA